MVSFTSLKKKELNYKIRKLYEEYIERMEINCNKLEASLNI